MVNIFPYKAITIAFEHRQASVNYNEGDIAKKAPRFTAHTKRESKLCDQYSPVDYLLKEHAMRRGSAFFIIVLCAVAAASEAEAKLDLYIDKSMQQISVIRNGALLYVWPISTARDRFSTPSGVYIPERLEPIWYSKAYYNTPMPHAIFFHNGYAIHGSYDIAQLGGPASHGCVRLHPQEAALLYAMVEQEGPSNTTIVVDGGIPHPLQPHYRDLDEPPRPPYVRDGGIPRGAYPPDARMAPYDDAYRGPSQYVGDPGRRRGDNSRLAMQDAFPPNRPPAPRLDAQTPFDPALDPRGGYRPPPPRLDAQAPFDPAFDPRGGYQSPPPRLDAQAPFDPALDPRGGYRPPPPRRDAQAPFDPALDPRGGYRPPPPRRDAQAPFDPALDPRGGYRPPPRRDAQAPFDPALDPRGGYRPPPRRDAQAPFDPALDPRGRHRPPATAKANSKCPTCSPNRASDERTSRNVSASQRDKSLPSSLPSPSAPPVPLLPVFEPPASSSLPSTPPAPLQQPPSAPSASSTPTAPESSEQQPPGPGYKVLPRSYWAGASWRWRLKAEHEINVPSLTPDAP